MGKRNKYAKCWGCNQPFKIPSVAASETKLRCPLCGSSAYVTICKGVLAAVHFFSHNNRSAISKINTAVVFDEKGTYNVLYNQTFYHTKYKTP